MRKVIITALVMAVISSCSKSEGGMEVSATSSESPIFSQAAITRVADGKWETEDKIGLFMIQNQAPVTIDETTYANYPYSVVTANAAASDFTATDLDIYFPTDKDARVGFYAYYPYQEAATNTYKYKVNVATQSTPSDIDFLEAEVADNGGEVYHKDNAEVALKFSHALSKLTLAVKISDDLKATAEDKAAITAVIKGYNTEVEYNFATNSFATPTAIADIAMRQVAKDGSLYDAILIPTAAVANSEIVFTFAGDEFVWDISNIELLKGQENRYTISISKIELKLEGSTIKEWGVGENDDLDADDYNEPEK